jgi:nicotinate-nucleotide pyrophosphorylase (carboxylating)
MSLFISPHVMRLIEMALDEDDVGFDVTSQIFFAGQHATTRLIAKQDLVVCGLDVARAVCERVDRALVFEPLVADGARLKRGELIGHVRGDTVSLLGAERTLLNFIQRMSGVATKTAEYVAALGNPKIRLADTRKTIPGWRELDKYAVKIGGGANHRFTLSGGVMLKDNHLAAAGGIGPAVALARAQAAHTLRVEVEVETLDQVREALAAGAEIIMLDNMDMARMAEAIGVIRQDRRGREVLIEISGNVTVERLPELAKLDVDIISTGAITHSVIAADISMKFEHAVKHER